MRRSSVPRGAPLAGAVLLAALVCAAPDVGWAHTPRSVAPAGAPDSGSSDGTEALGPGYVQTKLVAFVRLLPREDGKVVWEVPGHTLLRVTGCRAGWCELVMRHAGRAWIPRNLVEPARP